MMSCVNLWLSKKETHIQTKKTTHQQTTNKPSSPNTTQNTTTQNRKGKKPKSHLHKKLSELSLVGSQIPAKKYFFLLRQSLIWKVQRKVEKLIIQNYNSQMTAFLFSVSETSTPPLQECQISSSQLELLEIQSQYYSFALQLLPCGDVTCHISNRCLKTCYCHQ